MLVLVERGALTNVHPNAFPSCQRRAVNTNLTAQYIPDHPSNAAPLIYVGSFPPSAHSIPMGGFNLCRHSNTLGMSIHLISSSCILHWMLVLY